jgi:hypothetical protein
MLTCPTTLLCPRVHDCRCALSVVGNLPGGAAIVHGAAQGPRTLGARELEGVQEVVGLLEVRPHGVDLVDEVLDADDAKLAELALHTTATRCERLSPSSCSVKAEPLLEAHCITEGSMTCCKGHAGSGGDRRCATGSLFPQQEYLHQRRSTGESIVTSPPACHHRAACTCSLSVEAQCWHADSANAWTSQAGATLQLPVADNSRQCCTHSLTPSDGSHCASSSKPECVPR